MRCFKSFYARASKRRTFLQHHCRVSSETAPPPGPEPAQVAAKGPAARSPRLARRSSPCPFRGTTRRGPGPRHWPCVCRPRGLSGRTTGPWRPRGCAGRPFRGPGWGCSGLATPLCTTHPLRTAGWRGSTCGSATPSLCLGFCCRPCRGNPTTWGGSGASSCCCLWRTTLPAPWLGTLGTSRCTAGQITPSSCSPTAVRRNGRTCLLFEPRLRIAQRCRQLGTRAPPRKTERTPLAAPASATQARVMASHRRNR